MLDNVVKHAPDSIARTWIEASARDGRLAFIVKNALPEGADLERIKALVPTLEAHARGEGAEGYVRQEGGSGYYKLGKLLKYDLGRRKHSVNVAIDEEGYFVAQIEMESEGLLA